MAELGGMITSALLKVLGQEIGSVIRGQIKLQYDFDKDLEKMKETLMSVKELLKDAEKRSIMEYSVRLWLKQLKVAMYEISDMIDDFEAETGATRKTSLKEHLAVMIPCLTIGPKITLANKMKMMREKLQGITDEHQKFKLAPDNRLSETKVPDIPETSSTIEGQIVGRTEEEKKIWASLSEGETEALTVLPIYGIGGLGKSTLARMVYHNNSQFTDYTRMWVYVSKTFDLKKIGNSIITQLSGNESQYTGQEMIDKSLAKLLTNKKILIVLDDMWEEVGGDLDSLMAMLKVGESSKVVVIATTRSEGIAKHISTIPPHKLESLTDEMSWTIIKQKSDFESRYDKTQLEQIGKGIAKKCGGVALAAQSLGYMLQSLPSQEWESVRDSDIWTVSAPSSDPINKAATLVLASMRLSCSFMSSDLKMCFAYCAIFPKGHKIVKHDLIHRWVSLGFIKAEREFSAWQCGEMYIRQLLGLSFLEHSQASPTARVHFEQVTSFTMHDLVHDLARSVMEDEILVPSKYGNTGGICYHYALLDDCSKLLESPRIRALCFMDSAEIRRHDDAFSSAKSLRVLDLSECSIHGLPNSIGQLKRLRYLNAPRVQDVVIPDAITRLSKLIYLNLSGSSSILALPESIGEIEGLMYLYLPGCSGITELPKSFGGLKKLVHLDLSNCSSVCNVSEFLGSLTELQYLNLSGCKRIGNLPTSLGVLSELRYLDLSFSSYVEDCAEVEVLGALIKLEYLNLSLDFSDFKQSSLRQIPQDVGRFNKLKYLNLSGCLLLQELPMFSRNLKSLVHLDLSGCFQIKYNPEAFDGLTNLQYLNMSGSLRSSIFQEEVEIDRLLNRISTLPNLEHLDLSNNNGIYSLPESLGDLTKLHTLDLSNCSNLQEIPKRICIIGSLKVLHFGGCNIKEVPQLSASTISLPLFVVHAGDGKSSSNLVLLQDTNPEELQISRLENVKSADEAQSIKLMEKEGLKKLKLEWTRDAERFVDDKVLLEKLVPPSSLKKLEIAGYNGVSFAAWTNQLPDLESLVPHGMECTEEWSTSDSSGANDLIFPVLDKLVIQDCPMLRMNSFLPRATCLNIENSDNVLSSWGEIRASSSSSPVTTKLEVYFSELPLRQWSLLRHLPGLTTLSIEGCGDLTISPDIIRHMSSIVSLSLTSKVQEDLPKWLGELASLKILTIMGYTWQKELDENMRKLTKLERLYLRCNGMSSVPHWLIELTCLKDLRIDNCEGISSLPAGIQQLTNLKMLIIRGGPDLRKWCTENERKLAHIQTVDYRD